MNITLQTSKLNNQQCNYNKQNYSNQRMAQSPSFTSGGSAVRAGTKFFDSKMFQPFKDGYKAYYKFLGDYVMGPLANSKPVNLAADMFKNDKYIFNHVQAVGSFITSGMYAVRTLQNDKLDKDRRNTLAINQILTAILSTAGMYAIDGAITNTWEKNVSAKYAEKILNNDVLETTGKKYNVIDDFTKHREMQIQKNKELIAKHGKKAAKEFTEKPKSIANFVIDEYGNVGKEVGKRLKGMDLMRKMFIIGMVYRYLVPVLVVPIANNLGDKYIESKKAKEAATLA